MPAALLIPAITAAAGAGATIYAANKSSGAAEHAADLQSQANTQALSFEQQQAQQQQANFEATQRANYDQWAAREQRLSNLGSLVGLGPRQIPAYVPTMNTVQPSGTVQPATPRRTGQRRGTLGSLV